MDSGIQKLIEDIQKPENIDSIKKYIGLFSLALFASIVLYYISTKKNILGSKQYMYAFIIMVPILLLVSSIIFLGKSEGGSSMFGFMFLILLIIGGMIYVYQQMKEITNTDSYLINLFLQILSFCIILVGLGIFYKIFMNNLKKIGGTAGFIINLIFFLPCMFNDFIEAIRNEFKMTPSVVFILFLIELILFLIYFYIPHLVRKYVNGGGIPLLNSSRFLEKQIILANPEHLSPFEKTEGDNIIKTPRMNYSLSMWIYLNQQEHSSNLPKNINIFSYGSGQDFKPKIDYLTSDQNNSYKDTYLIHVSPATQHIVELPSQKWNNFVFNYNNQLVDIFINGHLVRTIELDEIPIYNPTDLVTIGQDNGANGAVCNIQYYTNPLTKYQIVNNYNLLMDANPPINNIL
jgi:hypothetical protein